MKQLIALLFSVLLFACCTPKKQNENWLVGNDGSMAYNTSCFIAGDTAVLLDSEEDSVLVQVLENDTVTFKSVLKTQLNTVILDYGINSYILEMLKGVNNNVVVGNDTIPSLYYR